MLNQVEYSDRKEMKLNDWRIWTDRKSWMGELGQSEIDYLLDTKAHDYVLAVTEHLVDNQIAQLQYELSLHNEEE